MSVPFWDIFIYGQPTEEKLASAIAGLLRVLKVIFLRPSDLMAAISLTT